jgi:TrmH family RNA methyltransferase
VNITVVLCRPQDLVNIAVVIRAMKNFGFRDLRLVEPADFDVGRIEGIAHKTGEIAQHTEIFESLDEALADFTCVAGLTARGRAAKRNAVLVDDAARELVALAETERVAILFGPEDKGLTNDDLDRCHRIVTIPTRSEHSSMNLAQAATVTCYELYRAGGRSLELKRPRRDAPPASREQLEQLFADAEMALESFEFFKSRNQKTIMRVIRELVHRGPADEREVRLLRAMTLEVQRFLERKGVAS